mmetsp:Transcript_3892/g.8719  ORF Transcript_3892/g.8719 Transcript_3892/m.8719 type:complete len:2464 (-) Transcript_3892:122-7513(-)|eukprot:CAMPEP_0172319110 /NCGR_PEP_ID=MMETSP1058-20130122/36809_1 /TAXON_ID=83371 /ORGANISM="Detonula confervacea, Strain CCMP 353" /LENGTH=2463 /DNA_ID=CAMNT_0013034075 /DNA_START=66 /DNA_END=7457 /DNA_ORIENTATION=-
MEEGSHVWLRSPKSEWGWLPAKIIRKEVVPKSKGQKPKTQKTNGSGGLKDAYGRFRTGVKAAPSSSPSSPQWPTPVNRGSSFGRSSTSSVSDNGPKGALVKSLDDARRKELQTIMRDRSLAKDERKRRMDEVKEKYTRLVEEAETNPTPPPEEQEPAASPEAVAAVGGEGEQSPSEEEKKKEEELAPEDTMIELTLVDDFTGLEGNGGGISKSTLATTSGYGRGISGYYAKMESFREIIHIDTVAAREEHPDIKLRNMPTSCSASSIQYYGESNVMNKGVVGAISGTSSDNHMPDPAAGQPATKIQDTITGGVDDLIGLTHLHEPAILHALRLRYDADIIYTSTGPILLAINPFKGMQGVYGRGLMDLYRQQGEDKMRGGGGIPTNTPMASPKGSPVKGSPLKLSNAVKPAVPLTDDGKPIPKGYLHRPNGKLPPHVYQAADDAYRAMMRGIEMSAIMKGGGRGLHRGSGRSSRSAKDKKADESDMPTNQSILVSGESGAGKTVTTKIVLNYFAMLSQKSQEAPDTLESKAKGVVSPRQLTGGKSLNKAPIETEDASIEQKVLQSNPILEAFGNARTIRNDNSSRFGKYINIAFTDRGQLLRASIDTYLLEKVRLLHQTPGERNFHVFYQFLDAATDQEREELLLSGYSVRDFNLTNQSDTYGRRDNVEDVDTHNEMVEAMEVMHFGSGTVSQLMRLVVAVLFAGNMTFSTQRTATYGDTAVLEETEASLAVAQLLGVSFDNLAASLTSKVIFARGDMIHKGMDLGQAEKANEALIKSIYGAAFDFIAEKINASINAGSGKKPGEGGGGVGGGGRPQPGGTRRGSSVGDEPINIVPPGGASIGVLDIFGFETFEVNAFEQLCINYTNETLQQQFNKFVFKLEQQEYEREGILWKFIPFPDNQDVLDLIDKPRTGILQILDEQCIVDWGTDQKFSLSLYSICDSMSPRFHVSPAQRVRNKFAVEHYAGFVEYSTENWLEKNKDQLPAASVELLESSDFEFIGQIKKFVRSEGAKIAMKSLGKQFSDSLKILRARIDTTMPHYVRCLKPNDALEPDNFDPKNIVEQLRYCGVLEAVRVSRAGYPTRYPHEVFVTRYYMLCPNRGVDEDNLSPYHKEISVNLTEEQKSLKRLVSRTATEVWKIEHEMFRRSGGPPEEPDNRHALARPKNLDEFMRLDFSSRCAVAGLQLGKTKVFLRREAFECIESIRNEKFGKNVTRISKTWRRYSAEQNLRRARQAALTIQCLIRMGLASARTAQLMKDFKAYKKMRAAAGKIQRSYRNHHAVTYKEGSDLRKAKAAVLTIQGCMRGRLARKRVFSLVHSIARFQSQVRTVKIRQAYLEKRNAIIKMQSIVRLLLARHAVEDAKRQRAALKIQSIVRMKWAFMDFRRNVDAASLIKCAYREHLYRERPLYGTFLKRYYMLGDPKDVNAAESTKLKKKKVMLARHRNAIINAKRLELTKLVNKLTLDLWEPGMFESFAKPKVGRKETSSKPSKPTPPGRTRPTPQAASAPAPEPTPANSKKKKFGFSLKKKKSAGNQSHTTSEAKQGNTAKTVVNGKSGSSLSAKAPSPFAPLTEFTPIPQTKEQFMTRLAPSRYALVGMQMCHGTVFLRLETYARLEKWRNDKVGGSSAKIQAAARRKLAVNDLKRKRAAVVKIQSFARMSKERSQLNPKRLEYAATRIQSIYRMSTTRKGVWRTYWSTQSRDLFAFIGDDNWYMVEKMLHKNPLLVEEADPTTGELPLHKIVERASAWTLLIDMILTLYPKAVVHKDYAGELPIHHAAHADNLTALEIIYESYRNGAKDADGSGRLPIHVAAEHGSTESIKYLTMQVPDGAHTVMSGGRSLPLHLACKMYSSVGVITSLLRTPLNFSLASRTDENGELPLHLLLRCGEEVDVVAVKTLLTCHLKAIGTRDQSGDIPLHIALKNNCKPAVIETLIAHFPGSSVVMDGEGHSPLFLALSHSAEDETTVSLINYAPQMVTIRDDREGKLPIETATENELSLFIVYRLLKQDMPIDLKERVQVRLIPHCYSWNHILLDVGDRYYQVVSKILQQCTQPQVLALAHVEDSEGKIALASATPICRHEIRVMLRLFNTLELVKQRPAFTNGASDTEIFYALRYEPPPEQSDLFSTDYDGKEADDEDYTEDWDDDLSQMSDSSRPGAKNGDEANLSVAEKLKLIRNEKGQHVIAKITPRSDIVERELKIRKDFNLSRHYVPSVISVHHTVHHGAYQSASAEAAYCITMEGADATVEHQMLDYRRAGKAYPSNELRRIGVSLLHLHENGLVHTDFGPHSVGKFGPLFKLLGVGGCVRIGDETNPKHGIYHPPDAISVKNVTVEGKERKIAKVAPVTASPAIDLWAFGHMVYESVVGSPLSAYSHRGQRVKSANLAKIARWDDHSLQRALRHVDAEDTLARDVISKFFHPDPDQRFKSIRDAIADPFFNTDSGDRKIKRDRTKRQAVISATFSS